MDRITSFLLTFGIIVLLAVTLIPAAKSLSLAALCGRAGLPYPEEGYEGTVYLKEAFITFHMRSTWGMVSGYAPWHSVTISHNARYVLENSGGSTLIQLRIPMSAGLRIEKGELAFRLDGQTMNYTSVEYIKSGPEPGSGTVMHIYTFTVAFSAQSQRIIEVQASEIGAASTEAQYTYYMMNAARWLKPIEKSDMIFQVQGGEFINSTIAPKTVEATNVTWSLTDLIPSQDLLIKWNITESQPSVPDADLSRQDCPWDLNPYMIIGVVVALIASFSVFYFLRRRTLHASSSLKPLSRVSS